MVFCRHGFHLHPDGAGHPEVSDSDPVRHAVGQDGVREQSDIWGGGLHLGYGTQLCRPPSTGMVKISAGVIRSQVRMPSKDPTSNPTCIQLVPASYKDFFYPTRLAKGHLKLVLKRPGGLKRL